MPKDPKDLMLLAARVNGLGPNMKPWHLKADFQTFDADGQPLDRGVFEEWWAASEKWKMSYSSKNFSQVIYRNGDMSSRMMTGDSGWIPVKDRIATHTLYEDFAAEKSIEKANLRVIDRKIGAVSLHCVVPFRVAPALMASEDFAGNPTLAFRGMGGLPTVCLNPDSAVVRAVVYDSGFSMVFDNVVQADGHYIPRDLWLRSGNLPIAHLVVNTLEIPARIDDSIFVAPPSAVTIPVQRYNPAVKAGHRTGGDNPTYPHLAKTRLVQGLVVLQATITKNGKISDLRVVSGPKELRQSAFDAVKTWKYKPYLLNGQPVEMETVINVIYTLGG